MAKADGGGPTALASPPCAAEAADDLYMGFAPRAELSGLCTALLRDAADDPDGGADEVRRLLLQALELLQAGGPVEPVPMSPAEARRALQSILPRVRDDRLHALLCRVRQRQAGAG